MDQPSNFQIVDSKLFGQRDPKQYTIEYSYLNFDFNYVVKLIERLDHDEQIENLNMQFQKYGIQYQDKKELKSDDPVKNGQFNTIFEPLYYRSNKLKVFSFTSNDINLEIMDNILILLSKATQIEKISIYTDKQLTLDQFSKFNSIIREDLKQLVHLRISFLVQNDSELEGYRQQQLSLRELEIKQISQLNQIQPILSFSQIQSLTLQFNPMKAQLLDQIIQLIVKSAKVIKKLVLSFDRLLNSKNQKCLQHIEQLSELEILCINMENQLTKKDLDISKLKRLKSLSLTCIQPFDYLIEFQELNIECLILANKWYKKYTKLPNDLRLKWDVSKLSYNFKNEDDNGTIQKQLMKELEIINLLITQLSLITLDFTHFNYIINLNQKCKSYDTLFDILKKCSETSQINLKFNQIYENLDVNLNLRLLSLANVRNFKLNDLSYYEIIVDSYQYTRFKVFPKNLRGQFKFINFYVILSLLEEYRDKLVEIPDFLNYKEISEFEKFQPIFNSFNRLSLSFGSNRVSPLIQESRNELISFMVSNQIIYLEINCQLSHSQIIKLIKRCQNIQFISQRVSNMKEVLDTTNLEFDESTPRKIQLQYFYQFETLQEKLEFQNFFKFKNHIFYFYLRVHNPYDNDMSLGFLENVMKKDNIYLFYEEWQYYAALGQKSKFYELNKYCQIQLIEKIKFIIYQKIIAEELCFNPWQNYYDLFNDF